MNPIINYNPDVLTCLANLSNDEVFTPPAVVNQMLDQLPDELWSDKDATFLDPVSKTGVFLREIAVRLNIGLEKQIPDKQERINHIYTKQLFGLALTELTSLLSRRSVYCSKSANGKYSICDKFDDEQGNILYERLKHTWNKGKCTYCGASEVEYNREDVLETYAYQFIHTNNPEKLFNNMKFDVIIGNPPYQMNDGGGMGTSAVPIYNKFVDQAKKMKPRYLSMIIPARWFSGGKGLDDFRLSMLSDRRLTKLVDYFDSTECFPGVDISGGVCYFLWDREKESDCEVSFIQNENKSTMVRPLLEKKSESYIRFNEAVSIIRKIQKLSEVSMIEQISSRKPFGIISSVKVHEKNSPYRVKIYSYPKDGYVEEDSITQNIEAVKKSKVFIAKAYGERGSFPYKVIGKPFLGEPGSCSSETYLMFGPYKSQKESSNVITYINTKFFRFLVLFKKNTQNAAKGVYSFVPAQDFSESWSDEKLYKKYNLSKNEIKFIESLIRPSE